MTPNSSSEKVLRFRSGKASWVSGGRDRFYLHSAGLLRQLQEVPVPVSATFPEMRRVLSPRPDPQPIKHKFPFTIRHNQAGTILKAEQE